MMKDQLQLFEHLTMIPGISGHEKHVAKALKSYYEPYADEIIYDGLGSIFAVKKSKAEKPFKVMLAGHMDEIGFIVQSITKNGMLKIHPIGGWNPQVLLAHQVHVYPSDDLDKRVTGVIASVPPHLLTPEMRGKVTTIDQMLVDVGVESKEEALALGILPGDMVVVAGTFEVLANENRLVAKSWDNRYGCIMGVELLRALKDVELPYDLYIGATVQEEVGVRGAQTAGNMISPDLAIVLDASPANDATGDDQAFGQLGQGGLIRIVDSNMIPNQAFIAHAKETFTALNLKYQYYLSYGGTDAGSIHKVGSGVPTLTACLPARYIHTSHTIIDRRDYQAVFSMLQKMLTEMNQETCQKIKEYNR